MCREIDDESVIEDRPKVDGLKDISFAPMDPVRARGGLTTF
jgi:hypothetical protein